jgi:hypothetical protein
MSEKQSIQVLAANSKSDAYGNASQGNGHNFVEQSEIYPLLCVPQVSVPQSVANTLLKHPPEPPYRQGTQIFSLNKERVLSTLWRGLSQVLKLAEPQN